MVTKVLAYADSRFSLVFPKPDIVTTVSYWTGTYPTITGPDWTSLALTTRTSRQTPITGPPPFSTALPSLELLKPSSSNNQQQLPILSEPAVSYVLGECLTLTNGCSEPTIECAIFCAQQPQVNDIADGDRYHGRH